MVAGTATIFVAAVIVWAIGRDGGPSLGVPGTFAGAQIHEVDKPIVVELEVGAMEEIYTASPRQRRRIAEQLARDVVAVVEQFPDQMIAVQLTDVPLSYASLPDASRDALERLHDAEAPAVHETSVARLLDTLIYVVQKRERDAVLSVVGLPIEPESAGTSLEIARASNRRYGVVIDRLGPFVPGRNLIVMGSSLDEKKLARMGMREALRLRDGRPIVFQTNVRWQALMDSGTDYGDYLVARSAGRGRQLEASLLDE